MVVTVLGKTDTSDMSKAHMAYFERDDVLHLAISDEPEAGSVG